MNFATWLHRRTLPVVALCLLIGPARPALAQDAPPTPAAGLAPVASTAPATPQAPAAGAEREPGYRIGPGDLLSIAVSNIKQFEQTVRVSNTGKIHVPFLGVIKVADMTPSELERHLAERLRDGGLVKDPWVGVSIQQYRAQPVYILGEVMDPGQFVIRDEMYLIDLITLAGGFNDVATPVGYLYRRRPDTGAAAATNGDATNTGVTNGGVTTGSSGQADEALEIDFRALNEGNRPDLNVKLRGGDVLYVPQRRKEHFFVVGDVNKPGAYEFPEPATLLTSQALAKAGGPMRTAKLNKAILVRFDEAGRRLELPVDIRAVFAGKKPEVPLKPNDIIFVPGSTAKTLAYGLLGAVPMAVEQTAMRNQ